MDERQMIEACADKGVIERPFKSWVKHHAFAVYPHLPGRLIAVAIAHKEGGKIVIDVIRENISFEDCCELVKAYGINAIEGTPADNLGLPLALAVCGVIEMVKRRDHLH